METIKDLRHKTYKNDQEEIDKYKKEILQLENKNSKHFKSIHKICYYAMPGILEKKMITIDYIIQIVCDYFSKDYDFIWLKKTNTLIKLTPEIIHIKTRQREILQIRQIAMFFSKNLTKSSLATIGKKIGDKNHSTVINACKTVNNLYDTDKKFRQQIDEIKKILIL